MHLGRPRDRGHTHQTSEAVAAEVGERHDCRERTEQREQHRLRTAVEQTRDVIEREHEHDVRDQAERKQR